MAEMTHHEYCALIGDKDVAIYQRNLRIDALTSRLAESEAHVCGLLSRTAELESRLTEQEAIIAKFVVPEPTPSLSTPSDSPES